MSASTIMVNEGTDKGVGGDLISSVFYQLAKVAFGDANTVTRVDTSTGLPVQPLTGATGLLKLEDAAHANGDAGVMPLGVRRDTPVDGASGNTDFVPLATDKYGEQRVKVGEVVVISASKTRPNDTNTYAAGDVINESTSAGTNLTFTSCARITGGSGVIQKVFIDDSANVSVKLQCELWLFNAASGTDNDNAVFTPTDAEQQSVVAVIPVNTAYVGDATSGAGGNALLTSGIVNVPFVCAADANLYGVLVARNGYIPVAQEVFNVRLFIAQD